MMIQKENITKKVFLLLQMVFSGILNGKYFNKEGYDKHSGFYEKGEYVSRKGMG